MEQRDSGGVQLNIMNSNVNIDNSFIPDIFRKGIDKHGLLSEHDAHRNWIPLPLANQSSKVIEKNLGIARREIIGTSYSKEKNLKKHNAARKYKIGYFSQANSPQF